MFPTAIPWLLAGHAHALASEGAYHNLSATVARASLPEAPDEYPARRDNAPLRPVLLRCSQLQDPCSLDPPGGPGLRYTDLPVGDAQPGRRPNGCLLPLELQPADAAYGHPAHRPKRPHRLQLQPLGVLE